MSHKNILLIFTDQQRYDTLEALGNPVIRTPALNSLVRQGISFTRAYTPCPVCIPARFCMNTGQMPHRVDCVVNETTPNDRRSFMEILRDHGYQTHGVGKMHFALRGLPSNTLWGFESRDFSEEGGGDDDFKKDLVAAGYGHVHDPHGVRSDMYYIPQPSQLPAKLHNSTWVADKSIEFLRRRDTSRPFMLMTSFIKPHPPFESPTPWNKLYRGPEMPLPKRPQDGEQLITYWNRFQNRYKYRGQGIDDNLFRQIKAAYYSAISFMDYNVGRLLAYMKENRLLDDTLVVFTSDHGEMLGDYNCVGKRNFLDSAARIPLLVAHPDLRQNSICSRPASLVDILPTFLEYAGISLGNAGLSPDRADLPAGENSCGKSLFSIAAGTVPRDIVYGQYQRNEYALYMAVTEHYKYIYSAPDQKEWLFDLICDPGETRNRAENPLFIGQRENLKNRLINYLKQDGYVAPFSGDNWKKGEVQTLSEDPDAYLLFQDTPDSLPHIPGYERDILDNKIMNEGPYKVGF